MRISELSRQTGVDARLLRYYETRGLLRPRRRPNGYREYQASDVQAVAHIRDLLAAGLSTATIATLPCTAENETSASVCAAAISLMHDERTRIDQAVAALQANRTALEDVIGLAHQRADSQGRTNA